MDASLDTTEYALQGLEGHVAKADEWAKRHFSLFKDVHTVSASFGVNFGLLFTITLTWVRDKSEPLYEFGKAEVQESL